MSTLLSFKRLNAWCTRVIDGDTVELDVDFPVRKKVRLVETVVVRAKSEEEAEKIARNLFFYYGGEPDYSVEPIVAK